MAHDRVRRLESQRARSEAKLRETYIRKALQVVAVSAPVETTAEERLAVAEAKAEERLRVTLARRKPIPQAL